MKAIKIIFCAILIAILLFVVGTLAKHNYVTRFERQTQKASRATENKAEHSTSVAIYDAKATDTTKASEICNHIRETGRVTAYSGQVFVVGGSKFAAFRDEYRYSTEILDYAGAILCIEQLDTKSKICEFNFPNATVEFYSAKIKLTLISWPTGELISQEIVDSDYDCPREWSGICDPGCKGSMRLNIDNWLMKHLVAKPTSTDSSPQVVTNPAPVSQPGSDGEVCWTLELKDFEGNRSQVWEFQLDQEIKNLLKYRQFLEEVVIRNPQLVTDGYVFHREKNYLLPELCH